MKTISVFIFLVIISPYLMAQITFEKTYGALEDEIGYCVEQTNDEGYILCGTTKSYDPYYLSKLYLVKTDKYGAKDWEKVFGVADFGELLKSIRQTDDDGYIACGQTNGPGDGSDFYLVKFTIGGDTSWTKKFNKGANDLAEWIEITKDGGYIICGMAKMANADIYIVKTDASGQVTWDKTIDVGKMEHGKCIQQTTDDGYIICGLQQDPVSAKDDVLLVKTNESGDTVWTRKFGTALDDVGFVVRQTNDEGYIICGFTYINDLNSEIYLIKTNSNGIQEWAKTYGGRNFDFVTALILQMTTDIFLVAT